MPNWTESMQRSYEFYLVDPDTWGDVRLLSTITSCSITRDEDSDTLGSGTFDIGENIGEAYIRVYMITIQNGVQEKHPLGTLLVQTPSMSFDGMRSSYSLDAYTPLIELQEKQPPIGFFVPKGKNIMQVVYEQIKNDKLLRAPVVAATNGKELFNDFVADLEDDNWLTFLSDLMSNAKYKFDMDEMGRILFKPKQEMSALQPVWTYNDDNSSILHASVSLSHDLYGIPNVVEVLCTNPNTNEVYHVFARNDDPNSPTSTKARGREIIYRDTDPSIVGTADNEKRVQEYAELLLRDLSVVEKTISYTHGYCPVRVGDCVRFNYTRSGLTNIKARVISQTINCDVSCTVTETAVYTDENRMEVTFK